MYWLAERFSDSDGKNTADVADRFVRSIPSFSETIEEVTEAIRKSLILAYGPNKYKNRRFELIFPTTKLLDWNEELGIDIGKEQEFDPIAHLEIADYPKPDRKFWARPPRTEVCAFLADIGGDRSIVNYKIILNETSSKIVFLQGAFKIARDRLSAQSLLQLEEIINHARPTHLGK